MSEIVVACFPAYLLKTQYPSSTLFRFILGGWVNLRKSISSTYLITLLDKSQFFAGLKHGII